MIKTLFTTGSVDNAALGFLDEPAVPFFDPIPETLAGFFTVLFPHCLPAPAEAFPVFLKNVLSLPVFIVFSANNHGFLSITMMTFTT